MGVLRECAWVECNNQTKNKLYCSVGCSNKGTPRRKATREIVVCVVCGKENRPRKTGAARGETCYEHRNDQEYLMRMLDDRTTPIDKERLFKSGLKERRCERCLLTEWLGELIPLELDHKNGDRTQNHFANLAILCANCHRLTPTWGGRNRGRPFKHIYMQFP